MYLPQTIGSKVVMQSTDPHAMRYLSWRGFMPESGANGCYTMRRDLADGAFGTLYPMPELPKFPVEILSTEP